jgi:hypothetical protein
MLSSHQASRGVFPQVDRVADLVGNTPLVQLQRSGDGRVWVKLEGLSAGGSFFDRVAQPIFRRYAQGEGEIVVRGATNFAYSMVALSRRRGTRVRVVVHRGESQRLVKLLDRVGANLERVPDAAAAEQRIGDLIAEGWVEARLDDRPAQIQAWTLLLRELAAMPVPMQRLVTFDSGIAADELMRLMSSELGHNAELTVLPWDGEQERTLSGEICSRRTQTGHREGFLVGPLGAEIIDRAVSEALTDHRLTVAVLPDSGHRYLGWW